MEFKELGKQMLAAAKPGLKMATKDAVIGILYDKAIDGIKKFIPGQWADPIVEGFRPQGRDALGKIVANW